MPNQFAHLGDRLVYSNGVLVLALLTAVLIVAFSGDSHALIPLFAVGVFLAFTLSQAGMVVHWIKLKGRGWQLKAFINGLGALVTASALVIVAFSKFTTGAWIVLVLIPTLVFIFRKVHFHYRDVSRDLALGGLPSAVKPMPDPRIVIPVSDIHRGVIAALRYARSISSDVTAVYVETNPEETAEVLEKWKTWGQRVPLVVVPSPYRSVIGPLLDYLDKTDRKHKDGQLASVLIPEFVPERWWEHLLHNQTAAMLKLAILYHRRKSGYNRAIIDVPYYLRD